MKLIEIIDVKTTVEPKLDVAYDPDKDFETRKQIYYGKDSSGKPLASGWYAKGEEVPDDPFMYKVSTHFPTKTDVDAKYKWVLAITKLKNKSPIMAENPFLPRYYNINFKPDKKGKSKLSYTMEKLYSIDDLISMYDKNTLTQIFKSVGDYIFQMDFFKLERLDLNDEPKSVFISMCDYIEHMAKGYVPVKGTSELKNAIKLVKKIVKDSNDTMDVDIHYHNILIRMTANMLQPVFTDPISDRGESIIGPKDVS